MNFRKIASLALAVLMTASVLCACADPQAGSSGSKPSTPTSSTPASQSNKTTYKVAVFEIDGKPATSGVVVRFMKNGEEAAIQTMNESGVAEKELEKGDYTVELMFTNQEIQYYYDSKDLTLSKTKTELTIHLCLQQSEEGETIYVNDMEPTAYYLETGNTYVTLKPGRNYFLYNPSRSGEYQLYTAEGAYVTGYFGGKHFVMPENIGDEAPNNGVALSVQPSAVSEDNSYIIGVDNPGTEDVQTILYAVRVSDYIDTSVPTRVYKTTAALTPWTAPAAVSINKFNITSAATYTLVLDPATGFYHLNSVDGPLVVVFLGKNAEGYMDHLAPYDIILKNSGVSAYFTNEDGSYSHREDYANCLVDYIGAWDETTKTYTGGCIDRNSGLYPLTEDLKYIIQQHGSYSGWWDISDERYLFEGMIINETNAWLFMCGYLE